MEVQNANEESTPPKKEVKLFGRNIAEIKCFRNSFICGICTGVAGGLITFMLTSKTRVSTHTAFASLWIGIFAYWIPCRYKYESDVLIVEQLKKESHLIHLAGNKEGTPDTMPAPALSSEENK